jgi:hypothetical protein
MVCQPDPRLGLRPVPDYVELHCLSNFTFLRGASHPHELVERANELGYLLELSAFGHRRHHPVRDLLHALRPCRWALCR